jgi:hypothetical protein
LLRHGACHRARIGAARWPLAMTARHTCAFSRHDVPSFATKLRPKRRRAGDPRGGGRREDRVRAAPAVSCAKMHIENAHEHTGSAETLRPSLRNGSTAYIVISLAAMLCHHRPREALTSRGLDASLGASGPHVFAVRIDVARLATQTRPPHPAPRFVTSRAAPLVGTGYAP